MGKLTQRQRLQRLANELAGYETYVPKPGLVALLLARTGVRATDHPGSKRPRGRLSPGSYVYQCPGCPRQVVTRKRGIPFTCKCGFGSVLPG